MEQLPAIIEREIPKLNEKQLRLLNHKIVARLKLINRAKALNEIAKFNLGDIVSFDYYGETISGRIIRINQKTVSVLTEDGKHKWNVSPHFLSKTPDAEDPESTEWAEPEQEVMIQELPLQKPATGQKISRNAPCPCGSGKKYKRCCGKDDD
jgi:hypothetical protein